MSVEPIVAMQHVVPCQLPTRRVPAPICAQIASDCPVPRNLGLSRIAHPLGHCQYPCPPLVRLLRLLRIRSMLSSDCSGGQLRNTLTKPRRCVHVLRLRLAF